MITEFQKIELVNYYKNGYTLNQISIKMKISVSTVIRWLKKYIETKNFCIKKKNIKLKTTIEENNILYDLAANNKKFRLNTLKNLLNEQNILLSKTTIWRRLKSEEYIFGKGKIKPKLTDKQKIKRLEWALNNKDTDWTKVNFSDEVTIYLNCENKFYWYIKGQKPIHRKQRHSKKLNVWAFINIYFGIGDYVIFNKNLNKELYEEILSEHLIIYSNDDFIFQQDNHPVHKSKLIKDYLKNNNINLLSWPSNSPDLNPIENLWKLVKDKLSFETLTKDNFEEKVRESINSIEMEKIYNMISSMHIRIQKVIDSNGDSIDY